MTDQLRQADMINDWASTKFLFSLGSEFEASYPGGNIFLRSPLQVHSLLQTPSFTSDVPQVEE